MPLRLSDIRRKLVRANDRLIKAEERYESAKKGKRAEARKKVTEARQAVREATRLFEKEEDRILRERRKKEEKARELKEKADKAREALKKHLEEDYRLLKKEREDYEREIEREKDAAALKKREEEEKARAVETQEPEPKPEPEPGPEPDIFSDGPLARKQPDPNIYPGRAGTGAFLQEEGWSVYFYDGRYPDVDFDAALSEPYSKGTVYPLSDWRGRDLVWWRAEVTLTFYKDPLPPEEDDGSHNPVTSLTREGVTPMGSGIYSVTGGTSWHAQPWQLENTVSKIISNIENKHGKTNAISVTWKACSRLQKPEIKNRRKA